MPTLKDRFQQFMLSTEGVESVDDLLKHCVLEGRNRADYLACDRRVVIEQKSIDVNPDYKIHKFLDKLANAGHLPSSGQTDWLLPELLRVVPDGPALFEELRGRVTKVLDDIIAKADDQTRDTKQTFSIPEAIGIVVVLNECAPLIFPDIAMVKLFDMLRKRRQNGELRYIHNQVIVLISEAHLIESHEDVTMFNMATVYSDAGNEIPLATMYTESLNEQWAAFNNAGYLESSELWDNFRPRDPAKVFTVVRPPPTD
jgi:hypothetical protein